MKKALAPGGPAVVFDLGGVVCRFLPERRLRAFVARTGRAADEVRSLILEASFNQDCDCGRYTTAEACSYLREVLGTDATDAEIQDLWCEAFAPDPECLALVSRLQPELPTVLLTDNGPLLLDGFGKRASHVALSFDHLVFSCDVGATKPDPRIFQRVEDLAERQGGDVVFIDDSASNVAAAIERGWDAIRFVTVTQVGEALVQRGLVVDAIGTGRGIRAESQ